MALIFFLGIIDRYPEKNSVLISGKKGTRFLGKAVNFISIQKRKNIGD